MWKPMVKKEYDLHFWLVFHIELRKQKDIMDGVGYATNRLMHWTACYTPKWQFRKWWLITGFRDTPFSDKPNSIPGNCGNAVEYAGDNRGRFRDLRNTYGISNKWSNYIATKWDMNHHKDRTVHVRLQQVDRNFHEFTVLSCLGVARMWKSGDNTVPMVPTRYLGRIQPKDLLGFVDTGI